MWRTALMHGMPHHSGALALEWRPFPITSHSGYRKDETWCAFILYGVRKGIRLVKCCTKVTPGLPGKRPLKRCLCVCVELCTRSTTLHKIMRVHNHKSVQSLAEIVHFTTFPSNFCYNLFVELTKRDVPGFAIGGLSGGEEKAHFWRMVTLSTDHLPRHKPRYLMGVGCVFSPVVICTMFLHVWIWFVMA